MWDLTSKTRGPWPKSHNKNAVCGLVLYCELVFAIQIGPVLQIGIHNANKTVGELLLAKNWENTQLGNIKQTINNIHMAHPPTF